MSLECEIVNNAPERKVKVSVIAEDFGVSWVPNFPQDGEEDLPHVCVDAKFDKVLVNCWSFLLRNYLITDCKRSVNIKAKQ